MEKICPRCGADSLGVASRAQHAEGGAEVEQIIRVCRSCRHYEIESRRILHEHPEALRKALIQIVGRLREDQLLSLASAMADLGVEDPVDPGSRKISPPPDGVRPRDHEESSPGARPLPQVYGVGDLASQRQQAGQLAPERRGPKHVRLPQLQSLLDLD